MKNLYFLFFLSSLFFATSILKGQQLEKFSEDKSEYMTQLHGYMTSSKRKALEETYSEFATVFRGGMFTEEEKEQILTTSNTMLELRMTASPYFTTYLSALMMVKKLENGDERFKEWHEVLDKMIGTSGSRRVQPFLDFIKFSTAFFEGNSLRSSEMGTNWLVFADDFKIKFEDEQPVVHFEKMDLMAASKKDSIYIRETGGSFFPIPGIWKGKGGKITWERVGLSPDVYAELSDYEIDAKRSLYKAEKAKMHYPLFFGGQAIEGVFSDKLGFSSEDKGGSFPRFESYDKYLDLKNIGDGVQFAGGFRIHGTTVYGIGTKADKAQIQISYKGKSVFRGTAELFTIKKEERVVGERVESTLYFENDSLYHPSVNFRFQIPENELQLSRGKRGSDRNPFYSSMHNINIDVEKINVYVNEDSVVIGEKSLAIAKDPRVFFESLKFFHSSDYQKIQNIATSNPIAIMKVTAEREGTNFIDANLIARRINSKFTVENINSLLYDLVSKGFINYDSDEQIVEVKDKVFHYADADQEKVDFDVLKIKSETSNTNAVLDLKNNELEINGIKNIEFSHKQKVALKPVGETVKMKANRNMDFEGKVFAGFSTMEGKDFHFDYDKFQIVMDSIRFFDLYVPTGELDENNKPVAHSIASRIEHVSGVLLIDAPSNKSGKENIIMFPSLQTKDNAYVYYDLDSTRNYVRDSFYFEMEPFNFDHLDAYTAKDIDFKGKFYSADIFPPFEESLKLQDLDQSLGFISETKEEGYPIYQGKGNYAGNIDLNNNGLQGRGVFKYLGASVNSEDILFKPQQLTASADIFDLEEDREGSVEVPQVRGIDVNIDWRPYNDSMYVRSAEAPFALFQENNHTLEGTLILTPDGLKGDGLLDWDKASMRSSMFSFGAYSAQADTTNLSIKAFDPGELALKTSNVNGFVNFDNHVGTFSANDEFLVTSLPYNEYETSMNEFDWDMEEETITFRTLEDKLGLFLSVHADQDSLRFQGKDATYALKTSLLKIDGVPHIVAGDAYIYPDSNYVEVQSGGVMATLENAKIVADTVNKYHVINRATVNILGKKLYKASGFYEYNVANREQEFELSDIIGQRVGKGQMSEKRVITKATGEVTEADDFIIDHKTQFQGTISLSADDKNLQFDGFARLNAEKLAHKYWFTVSSKGDKKDLAIKFDVPKSYDGEPLRTGLYLSKETARVYPRVMMPLFFRKDRPILPATGVFKYDKKKDQFIFGDSTKVMGEGLTGNMFTYHDRTGNVDAEGKFSIGSALKYVKVDAAGTAKTAFAPPPPEVNEDIMAADDTLAVSSAIPPQIPDKPVTADLMAGIKLIVPDNLLKIMMLDFQSSSFDAQNITYLTDINFYKKAALEIFPKNEEITQSVNGITSGFLDIPQKFNDYTFLFSKLELKWDPDYQSFVTTSKRSGLATINGEPLNKMITTHVEFKMPTNEDDRMYIYLKSPSELFYYFDFKQGILGIASNNTKFMEELNKLKSGDLITKMEDGETYEIQPLEPARANLFVRRVEAINKN